MPLIRSAALRRAGAFSPAPGPGGDPQTAIASIPAIPGSANGAHQRGPVFTFAQAVTAIGARVWVKSNGNETLRLWRVSDETLLASVEVVAVANEWVEGMFSSPVALTSGVQYCIATRRTDGSSRSMFSSTTGAEGMSFNPLATFVQSRSINGDAFPSGTLSTGQVVGLADIIFTA